MNRKRDLLSTVSDSPSPLNRLSHRQQVQDGRAEGYPRATHVVVLAANVNPLAHALIKALQGNHRSDRYRFFISENPSDPINSAGIFKSCIFIPSYADREGMVPDIKEAERMLQHAAALSCESFILLSSALIYGTGSGRHGMVGEEYSPPKDERDCISNSWASLEQLASVHVDLDTRLTILRPVTVLPSPTLLSRLLSRKAVTTLAGYDPVLQLLSTSDLAEAICCALEKNSQGTFNVSPSGVVPLHTAVRYARGRRIPLPHTLHRFKTKRDVLEYLRYPWTVSNEKIKRELGFVPRKSSTAALLEHSGSQHVVDIAREPAFDEFGMDKKYIHFYGKTVFRFLCNYYWRIETRGLEHIPREGPGVLVGTHRGFMPFDGVMSLHILVNNVGRYPRFLTHPALLRFPFLANFMTKLGGVVACQDTAERILQSGEIVGIFPEGIDGAFSYYRDAYQLQKFGRDAFIKMALRHRAPILPYVIVGSAEMFPVFGKINSRLWTRRTGWPCLPITPTFPLLPVPLPSKWHIQFLPPIHVEWQYGPEAARDRSVVKAISAEVRKSMQDTLDTIVGRRQRIFWGSVFDVSGPGRNHSSTGAIELRPGTKNERSDYVE